MENCIKTCIDTKSVETGFNRNKFSIKRNMKTYQSKI